MPNIIKKLTILSLSLFISLIFIVHIPSSASCNEGIELYYIRYDVKTSKHQIVDTNLIMIPGENEFRTEKFSTLQTYGAISATYNESENTLTKFAKENAIISLLRENGLRSVHTKDYDTVVSYEGAIRTPVIIMDKGFEKKNRFLLYQNSGRFQSYSFS